LVDGTSKSFDEVAGNAAKVGTLIHEITTATNEQAQGITQVNAAIGDMDQVTQANAASSEELAASSEELSAQALSMNDSVGDLVGIVEGEEAKNKRAMLYAQKVNKKFTNKNKTKAVQIEYKKPAPAKKSSEHLIPFDDDYGSY